MREISSARTPKSNAREFVMPEKLRKSSSDLIAEIVDALISDNVLSQAYEISSKSIMEDKMKVDDAIKFLDSVYNNENKRIEQKEKFISTIIDKIDTKIEAIIRLADNENISSAIKYAINWMSEKKQKETTIATDSICNSTNKTNE